MEKLMSNLVKHLFLHNHTLLSMFCVMVHLAPHALHHIALSSYMAHLSARPHVHGAGTRGADGASSSRRVN
jgi:hypothetical protein